MTGVPAPQWEFLQTRAVKWKWRQVGGEGAVLCESPEFAFLAHCMRDAERNGFTPEEHVLSCDKGLCSVEPSPFDERRAGDRRSPRTKASNAH
jgi:hypothetical protein